MKQISMFMNTFIEWACVILRVIYLLQLRYNRVLSFNSLQTNVKKGIHFTKLFYEVRFIFLNRYKNGDRDFYYFVPRKKISIFFFWSTRP